MLRDGRFIRERPPKIGAHYVPKFYQTVTESGRAIEQHTRWRNFYDKHLSSFEVGAWLVVIYAVIAVAITGLRSIYHALFG
jgi:hypothetical protein